MVRECKRPAREPTVTKKAGLKIGDWCEFSGAKQECAHVTGACPPRNHAQEINLSGVESNNSLWSSPQK
jgi:hypothetical protein